MKKIYYGAIAAGFLLILTGGCVTGHTNSVSLKNRIYSLNADKTCTLNSTTESITTVLKKAQMYNSIAKKDGVEFLRHKISTTKLIKMAYSKLKKGQLNDAATDARKACIWSIRAVQQEEEPGYRLSEN